jgi:chromosome partitioning protein
LEVPLDTLVVTNQKGGVGRSTIVALLAWWLTEKQKARVAVLDLDAQKNLSHTLAHHRHQLTAAQLFGAGLAASDMRSSGLCLFPGETELADLERASTQAIRNFQNNVAHLSQHFDYCLIDTPAGLGLRMTAALVAADYVLCPFELEEYSMDAVMVMIKTILGVRQRHNPRLKFLGLLANRFNPHSVGQREALQALLTTYRQYAIPAKISTHSAIPEALSQRKPLWRLPKASARQAAAEFYMAFELLLERMRVQAQPRTGATPAPSTQTPNA